MKAPQQAESPYHRQCLDEAAHTTHHLARLAIPNQANIIQRAMPEFGDVRVRVNNIGSVGVWVARQNGTVNSFSFEYGPERRVSFATRVVKPEVTEEDTDRYTMQIDWREGLYLPTAVTELHGLNWLLHRIIDATHDERSGGL